MNSRELLSLVADRSGLNRLLRYSGTWQGLLVLNYHRIGDPRKSKFDHGLWSALPAAFESQVAYLVRHFDVIALSDLDDVSQQRDGRFVLLTFDDGYIDNYTHAYPTLRKFGCPATFFVTTGFIDRPQVSWWDEIAWMVRSSPLDRLHPSSWNSQTIAFGPQPHEMAVRTLLKIYKALRPGATNTFLDHLAESTLSGRCPAETARAEWMTWDMIREMRDGGMTLGGHTKTHPVLATLEPDQQQLEIAEGLRRLESELGQRPAAFSYPVGNHDSFNEITRACLANEGIRWAFSYYGGYSRFPIADCYDIPRVAVERDVDMNQCHSITSCPQVFS
ncbi:MAG: polysaccharide deacetylase family protein [Planctomycetaceae bacterium]